MLKVIRLYAFLLVSLLCLDSMLPHAGARAWFPKGSSASQYANACGTVSASQKWCVGTDGWTTFSPTTTGTGSCGATGDFTGTCVTYIAEGGTGTSATCRIKPTGSFSMTDTIPDSQACAYTPTNMSLARDNSSDFLLFKRGDCFVDPGQTSPCTGSASPAGASFGICTSSAVSCNYARDGASANAPLVIGAYGPYATAQPLFISINNCYTAQAANGNYTAIISLACDKARQWDYTNATYNPGIITAASPSAAGATTITLSSPPSTTILTATNVANGWQVMNFSNPTEMRAGSGATGMRISSISGSTVTLQSAIPVGWDIAAGDRIVFFPLASGGISNSAGSFNWFYVEDFRGIGGGVGWQQASNGSFVWPNGPLFQGYIRRSVIYDSNVVGTRNQGIFISDTYNPNSTVLIEENIVDHTAWRQTDPDCTPGQFLPAKCNGVASTQFENFYGNPNNQAQGLYDHENCCVATFNRNILTNGGGAGIQMRSGGTMYNNFYARNNTQATGGGIMGPNNVSYNVFAQNSYSYNAILQVTGVAGNVLTFASVPQSLISSGTNASQPFNASNPSGISQTTNTSFTTTTTTVTIGGPAITVSVGDWIYFVGTSGNGAGWGFIADSTSLAIQSKPAYAYPTNAQWNVFTDANPAAYRGGSTGGGFHIYAVDSSLRATGNVIKNNYLMNQPATGIQDEAQILGVDGNAACGGQVRVLMSRNSVSTNWLVGDSIVTAGIQPSSMNANASTTVSATGNVTISSTIYTYVCLAGTTFGTGTWTSGTGTVNGGIDWGTGSDANKYYNVGTPASTTQATPTAFTPVGTTGCPQHTQCPSIESYDLAIGGDGTLAHFISGAKANRRGSWDSRYTAAVANNHIRYWTSASIPLPSL